MKTAQEFVNALKAKGAKNVTKVNTRLLYIKGPDEVPAYKVEFLAGTLLIYDGVYTPNENDEKLDAGSEYFVVTMFPYGSGFTFKNDEQVISELGLGPTQAQLVSPDVTEPEAIRFFSLFKTEDGQTAVNIIANYAKSWISWVMDAKAFKKKLSTLGGKPSNLSGKEQRELFLTAAKAVGLEAELYHSILDGALKLKEEAVIQFEVTENQMSVELSIKAPPMPDKSELFKIRSDLLADSAVAVYGESARNWLCYGVELVSKESAPTSWLQLPKIDITLSSEADAKEFVKSWTDFNDKQELLFDTTFGDLMELFTATAIDFTPDDADATMPDELDTKARKALNLAVNITSSKAKNSIWDE